MPPDQATYCTVSATIFWMATLCSTLFILSMTFERFYSIIRPHKAASFNTVKRAKITVTCSTVFSVIYNVPHIFITTYEGNRCGPFGKAMQTAIGRFYYWFSLVISFILPFILLLIMNSFIIHTIHQRSKFIGNNSQNKGQGHDEGQIGKIKNTEMQVFVILLLVTFGFLILTTPAYAFFLYINIADFTATTNTYAGYLLFHSIAQKLHYTNFGINLYLYVISGSKFREDLLRLFIKKKKSRNLENNTPVTSVSTIWIVLIRFILLQRCKKTIHWLRRGRYFGYLTTDTDRGYHVIYFPPCDHNRNGLHIQILIFFVLIYLKM